MGPVFFCKGVARSWCGSGPFSKTSKRCNLQRLTHSKAGKRCHLQHLTRAKTSEHCNLQQLKRRRPKSGEPHLCKKKARATPVQKKNLRPSGVCIYIYIWGYVGFRSSQKERYLIGRSPYFGKLPGLKVGLGCRAIVMAVAVLLNLRNPKP